MDKTDQAILYELQLDGRISNQELASKVNLSPSPCLRRVKQLEERGIIRGYTALVDNEKYGLPITVFVRVELVRHSAEVVKKFEQEVSAARNVLECFVMTGRADYLLKVVVKDLHDYEHFVRNTLQRMDNIASIDTSFAYGVVKHANALPNTL
ncbi:Lrp/AsnC family transcriptional regulator [Ningiella sp. W23]|uniref:Lrp/AsnC family transcriptional regulator n=1 Tax=Ningiella sp. W23 TaxID=3023715 RepID=UPI0037579FDE